MGRAPVLGRQGSGHGGGPRGLLLAEGVAEDEELAHAGDEGHLGRLADRDVRWWGHWVRSNDADPVLRLADSGFGAASGPG